MQVDFIFLGKSYFYTFETYALTVLEIIWENAQVDFPKIFQTSDQKDLEGMGPVSRFSSIILSNYQ